MFSHTFHGDTEVGGSWWKADFTNNDGSNINGRIQVKLLDDSGNWGSASKVWSWTWLKEYGIYRIEDADGNFISEITGGGHRYVVDPDGTIHKYVNKGNQLKLKDHYKFDGTSFIDTNGNTTALADLAGGKTFVVNKSASSTSNYKIDGADDPTLTLFRGKAYTFDMSGSGHPFYLKSTSSTSGTSDEYTTGVVRNGSSGSSNDGDSLVFNVPYSAPDALYYQCSVHAGMLGTINILDADIRLNVPGGKTSHSSSVVDGDTLITISNLTNNYFNSGNTDVASNEPTIKISNDAILEALPGVKIGTLSAGDKTGTFSLTNSESYLTISGNDLKLTDGFILDYESGKVFDGRSGSWDPSSPIAWNKSIGITLTESDGTVTTGTITTSIANLDETITVAPVSLALNKFGGTVALLSTNSVHLTNIILGHQNKHDYFEIVGKLSKATKQLIP